jgi:hypothetical protein
MILLQEFSWVFFTAFYVLDGFRKSDFFPFFPVPNILRRSCTSLPKTNPNLLLSWTCNISSSPLKYISLCVLDINTSIILYIYMYCNISKLWIASAVIAGPLGWSLFLGCVLLGASHFTSWRQSHAEVVRAAPCTAAKWHCILDEVQ